MKKILVLDANSLLNRAFYGIRPLTTHDGLPTNAVFGYINILKKHLDAEKPDFAVAAFDVHAPTFRHKLFSDYKGTRKPMPEELAAQLPYLRKATEALGITILEKEGYEADDLLGTLSRQALERGDEAVLVTGDRDSYQLVRNGVTVILAATNQDIRITPAYLQEKYGLEPTQLIDVKALAGDTSDNIPGVRGIGEKTAVKLIAECGDLATVYEKLDEIKLGPSAKEKLKLGKEDAQMSRVLAEINRNVPDLPDFDALRYNGIQKEALKELLVRLEFYRMLKTFELDGEIPKKEENAKTEPAQGSLFEEQGTLFDTEEKQQEAKVPLSEQDIKSFSPSEFYLFYDEEAFYSLSEGKAVRLCGEKAEIEAFLRTHTPIVCDYKAYLHRFAALFGDIRDVKAEFDLFLAAYLADSQNTASTLSRLMLLYAKKSLPFDGEKDPATALAAMETLYPLIKKELEEEGVSKLFYETELPLAYVLAKMELTGFAVSREALEKFGEELRKKIAKTEEEIFEIAGEEFSINSTKQLGRILYEKLQLPVLRKTKTGASTDAETLQKLRFASPIIDKILAYRTYSKLNSTYVVGMLSQIADDGRIHTFFNQMLTATGRLSSAEPNLQNIPVKTELGREMRRFFVAKEGFVLCDADYSQIELRLLAHMSGDENLIRFFCEGRDIHTKTAAEIFGVSEEEVTPEMRKSAKAVNFGIVYGIGEYSLSQDIGVSMREAKEYIQNYFSLFPGIKTYLEGSKARAYETGFAQTLFGRRRVISELSSPKKTLRSFGERVAMNAPIQGTAADIIKIAMVGVDKRLEAEGMESRLVLQVHDELILECPEKEAKKAAGILQEEMEKVLAMSVPLVAEAKCGKNWLECK